MADLAPAWYVISNVMLAHDLDNAPAAVLNAKDSVGLPKCVYLQHCAACIIRKWPPMLYAVATSLDCMCKPRTPKTV